MKRSTKVISILSLFFFVIAIVIIGRMMIGNHSKKKFSKIPPPGIIVTEVVEKEFSEKISIAGVVNQKSWKYIYNIEKEIYYKDESKRFNLKSFKHALEWDYFVGVISFYLLSSLMWKKQK